MKTQFIVLMLSLSTMIFSFYKLKGPYATTPYKNNFPNGIPDNFIIPFEYADTRHWELYSPGAGAVNTYRYLCIYNRQTGYSIGYVASLSSRPPEGIRNEEIINFFKGKDQAWITKWENNYLKVNFYFLKEEPDLILDQDISPLSEHNRVALAGCRILKQVLQKENHPPGPEQSIPSGIKLNSKFTTSLGITIENGIDNVQICKDNNKIYFKKALKKWFDFVEDSSLNDINNTIVKIKSGINESELEKDSLAKNSYELSKIANGLLDDKAKNLLKNSKILAIYAVVKGDDNKDSIVWGLAQDQNNPERRFQYIVDLKDDISKLIK